MSENLNNEKQQRELWFNRYETERNDHAKTQEQLMAERNQLKDAQITLKGDEIQNASNIHRIDKQ